MERHALAIVAACLLTACGTQATSQSSPPPSPSAAAASPTPSPSASPTTVDTPAPAPQPVVSTPRPTAPPMMAALVKIMSFAFAPSTLSVHTGTRVTFTNRDAVTHTVTADGGLFNSGDLVPGQSFSFTFMGRGSFAYHCRIHPSMMGTITVTG